MPTKNQHNPLPFNLKNLQPHLGGTIETINGIHSLHFSNANGNGRIRHLAFDEGLIAVNVEVSLSKKLVFQIESSDVQAFHFIFCMEGHCSHSFEDSPSIRKLEQLQTVVTASGKQAKNTIHINPNIKTILNIICVDNMAYFKKQPNATSPPKARLTQLLNSMGIKGRHIHFGTYNMKIGEHIKSLLETKEEDLMTELMRFQATNHLILANHIEQLYNESNQTTNKCALNGCELKNILDISEQIKANPQEPYSIDKLCHATGLSPAKLQEGFKALNNRTVSDYIRHIRLLKAEELMKNTDLNISEIVYSIGFTSRSYFCKIFKNEYGSTPKQYKKTTNMAVGSQLPKTAL